MTTLLDHPETQAPVPRAARKPIPPAPDPRRAGLRLLVADLLTALACVLVTVPVALWLAAGGFATAVANPPAASQSATGTVTSTQARAVSRSATSSRRPARRGSGAGGIGFRAARGTGAWVSGWSSKVVMSQPSARSLCAACAAVLVALRVGWSLRVKFLLATRRNFTLTRGLSAAAPAAPPGG